MDVGRVIDTFTARLTAGLKAVDKVTLSGFGHFFGYTALLRKKKS